MHTDRHNPKISIIIPVYNVAPYIEVCLESVLYQTYQNIEILIIDDCGNDNSMSIVENIVNRNNCPIRIIHHPKNLGLSNARNTGIHNSTGDYLYFLDSDDFISKHCIDSFVQILNQFPEVDIIFGSSVFYPDNWASYCIDVKNKHIPAHLSGKKNINNLFFSKEILPITATNKLIRKKYLLNNQLFFKPGLIYEDNLWYYYIGQTCTSIAFNKTETYYYRNNVAGLSHKYGAKELKSEITIIKEVIKNIQFKHLFSQAKFALHFAHSSYCKRNGSDQHPIIRYFMTLCFILKCFIIKVEE